MKCQFFFFIFLFSLLQSVKGEKDVNRPLFQVYADSVKITVSCLSDQIIHVQATPEGSVGKESLVVLKDHALKPSFCSVQKGEEGLDMLTAKLKISYSATDKCISFIDRASGRLLLKEKMRDFVRQHVGGEDVWNVRQMFSLTPEEAIYGLGQYQEGAMNYRGKKVKLLQANKDIVNPFLISTRSYGILWDNYSKTLFEDNEYGATFWSEVADEINYYFIAGDNMNNVIANYHALTGKAPMFPKSAFGYWQSKERYKSFDELTEVVAEYRRRQIPLDNIVQDWEYWGDRPFWNNLKFDTVHFNHPKEAIDRLHEQYHVKLMLSVWPGVGEKTDVYRAMDAAGVLFDEPTWAGYKVMDVYNPKAREIFWSYLQKGLFDKGVDAWWMDATEPSFRDGAIQEKQEERSKSAGQTYIGSFHRYLSVYSLFMSEMMYNNLRKQNDKRVFILTRSAFAGQQRYGAAIWSGDITARWDVFRHQISGGLNICMTGIPYWTTDAGAFVVTGKDSEFKQGLADPAYRKFYLRWFQQNAFSPIFRAHGTSVPREVWQFGQPGDSIYEGLLKMIDLRYRLLSYIYSSAWQVTTNSRIMMRGLAMDFTADPKVYDIDDSYMFGPAFLVHPVTSAEDRLSTYLPSHTGKYWFDFYNHTSYEGGQTITQNVPIDKIPVFVKAGSIVPFNDVKQYATEKADDMMDICVFTGADAEFELYEDDNETYAYEKGEYSVIRFNWNEKARTLTIAKQEGSYQNLPERTFRIKLISKINGKQDTQEKVKTITYKKQLISVVF